MSQEAPREEKENEGETSTSSRVEEDDNDDSQDIPPSYKQREDEAIDDVEDSKGSLD